MELTSISKKGRLLTLAFPTNIFHIVSFISQLEELGLDTEVVNVSDGFVRKK